MKTVALKDFKTGGFTMMQLTGFGSISSDNREDYGTRVSLGNVKTSLDLKETRIVTLEDDKVIKDSKISNIESDIELLASQVSLGNVRVSLGNLAARVTSLETLGISGISNAVSWTNLSEINLSGEKLTNGDFSSSGYVQDTSFCLTQTCGLQPNNNHAVNHLFAEADRPKIIALQAYSSPTLTEGTIYRIKTVNTGNEAIQIENLDGTSVGWTVGGLRGTVWEVVKLAFDNWTVTSGTLDETKLASGIVKGDGGQVSIQQTLSQNIAQGTDLVIKVTSDDDIKFYPILSNGVVDNANSFDVLASNGYAEHTTQTIVSGFRISTVSSTREYSSASVFQGAISGGTVQAYAGGGLEKISGTSGYNSGGFSVNYIPG